MKALGLAGQVALHLPASAEHILIYNILSYCSIAVAVVYQSARPLSGNVAGLGATANCRRWLPLTDNGARHK